MPRKLTLILLACILLFSACTSVGVPLDPDAGNAESMAGSDVGEAVAEATPTPAPAEPEDTFVPDYEEGKQNTEWGNLPGNINFYRYGEYGNSVRYGGISRQDGYLYYSLSARGDKPDHLYKMPVDGTTAEDVVLLVNKADLSGAISQIQVIGDWIYFLSDGSDIYRVRTDGSLLELLHTSDYSTGFVVHKDRIYYTHCTSKKITASTYEYHSMLLSKSVDGDVRVEFDLALNGYSSGGGKVFNVYTYVPGGYIIVSTDSTGSDSEWLAYSIEDGSVTWNPPEVGAISMHVDPNGGMYFKCTMEARGFIDYEVYYCESVLDMEDRDSYSLIMEDVRIDEELADENGIYFRHGRNGFNPYGSLAYYDRQSEKVYKVCPDDASSIFMSGDGYLYYYANYYEYHGWCRIATANGSTGTDWEQIDWMRIE